ncbi:hypothetical protein RB2501_05765 [Robiginitalea biformata HTCC2501]|uniref:Uncharacterized protein n=1 Tax=Robiginitalea biformata (strain ATCC BAA-864 / DSM 15991 / KCTC 12146 / HTCC2501) TaxID=313596 RepID=A4CHH3_ROBBH|nr:hypothetical protein RB2501_05765 [Robiginitalea biformata HTCC2501]
MENYYIILLGYLAAFLVIRSIVRPMLKD